MPIVMFIKTAYRWLAELLGGLSPVFLMLIVLSGYYIKTTITENTLLKGDVATLKMALENTVKESKAAEERYIKERDILEKNSNVKQEIVLQKCDKEVVVAKEANKTKGQEKVDEKDILGSKLPDSIIGLFK